VVYMCLTPLFAVLAAAVLLGERPRPLQAVGAVMILAGVVLTRRPDEARTIPRGFPSEG